MSAQASTLVWLAFLEHGAQALLARESVLDAGERARAARFHQQGDRQVYVAAHVLLRLALAAATRTAPAALRFEPGPFGRPELAGSRTRLPSFNLSHTRGLAVVALAQRGRVGVDAERVDPELDARELADWLAPAEAADLLARDRDSARERFYRYWTLKEAYFKARGEGLSLPLDRFELALDADPVALTQPAELDDSGGWQLVSAEPRPGYRVGVAQRPPADISWHSGLELLR